MLRPGECLSGSRGVKLDQDHEETACLQVTNHLVTHLHVVRRMLGTRFEIEGGVGEPGTVRLTP